MWLFRKKAEQSDKGTESIEGEVAEDKQESEQMEQMPKSEEKTPASPGGKSKNRRRPGKKNNKGSATASSQGEQVDADEAASGTTVESSQPTEGTQEEVAATSQSLSVENGAAIADLQAQLDALQEKNKEVNEQLAAATAAQEGLEKALDVTNEQLRAAHETIQSMKEKEAETRSEDRELCVAMKERMCHLARGIGEESDDWKVCSDSLERAGGENRAAKILTDKVLALARSVGEESNDPNEGIAAIGETATKATERCAAMNQKVAELASSLGVTTDDWEESATAIAKHIEQSAALQNESADLKQRIMGAATALQVDCKDAATFFAFVPTLQAEREVWVSAKNRVLVVAKSHGVDSSDWVNCLNAVEKVANDGRDCAAIKSRLQDLGKTLAGTDSDEAEECLGALEKMARECVELRGQRDVTTSQRQLFKEAMDGLFALARNLGEESGDWRQCLSAVEHAATFRAESVFMQEKLISLARKTGDKSTEWRACADAVERQMDASSQLAAQHSLVTETLQRMAASAGETSQDLQQCLTTIEEACRQASQPSHGADGPARAHAMEVVKELHLLLLSMQAQGWEFSSFFKTAVPDELRRSEVYQLLQSLMSEHQDRTKLATKHRLYHFSDEEDMSEEASDPWLSPPVDSTPLFPVQEAETSPPDMVQGSPEGDPGPNMALYQTSAPAPDLYSTTSGAPAVSEQPAASMLYQSMATVPVEQRPVASLYQSSAQIPVQTSQFAAQSAASAYLPNALSPILQSGRISADTMAPLSSSAPQHPAPISAPPWLGNGTASSDVAQATSTTTGRRGSLEQFVSSLMEPNRPLTFYYGASEEASPDRDERRQHFLRHHRPTDPTQPQHLQDSRRELQYGSMDWHPGAAGPPAEEVREARVRFQSPAQTPPTSTGSTEWSTEALLAQADSHQLQSAMWNELGLRLKAGADGGGVRVMEKALGNVGFAVRDVRAGDNLIGVNGWACAGQDVDTVSRFILGRRMEGLLLGLKGRKGGTYQVTVPPPMTYSEA